MGAHLRGNAVEVTDTQLPDLHAQFVQCCEKLSVHPQPRMYVQNGNGVLDRGTFNSAHPALPLPDADPTGVTSSVAVHGLDGPACDITVTVMLSHPCLSDLTITLVAPNGERVVLFRNRQVVKLIPDTALLVFRDDVVEEASDETPLDADEAARIIKAV